MKPKKFNYILFVFAQSNKQERFTKEIGEEIVILTKSDYIRYFYGESACIYTFKTDEDLNSVSEFIDIILSEGKINYFLLPYSDGNVVYGLDKEVSDHLFGNNPNNSDIEKIDEEINESFDKLNHSIESLKDKFDHFFGDMDDLLDELDEDDDEISKLIKKSKQPKIDNNVSESTFNSILDKINIHGIEGLTEKELSLLKKYSSQIK